MYLKITTNNSSYYLMSMYCVPGTVLVRSILMTTYEINPHDSSLVLWGKAIW